MTRTAQILCGMAHRALMGSTQEPHIYHRLQTAIAKSNRDLLRSFKGA